MKYRRYRSFYVIMFMVLFLLFNVFIEDVLSEFLIIGKIESFRKPNRITIILKEKPLQSEYYIIQNKKSVGEINIIAPYILIPSSQLYRIEAEFVLKNGIDQDFIKAGEDIAITTTIGLFSQDYGDTPYREVAIYRKKIITHKDNREMVLISGGKFIFGSNDGDRDEYPRQIIHLEDYYIDKYEVSNSDFLRYMSETHRPPPHSWSNKLPDDKAKDLPVLVTYHEAEEYAKWADKRLPSEEEWEKAARGVVTAAQQDRNVENKYPWGATFDPVRTNSLEFWSSNSTGSDIKKMYQTFQRSFLPVYAFPNGASPYNVFNMAGNALEWTSSWYKPYKGNNRIDSKYGTQYKVLRGGDFSSPQYKVRVTNREIGGSPNLYNDFAAGFRCVREARSLDAAKP